MKALRHAILGLALCCALAGPVAAQAPAPAPAAAPAGFSTEMATDILIASAVGLTLVNVVLPAFGFGGFLNATPFLLPAAAGAVAGAAIATHRGWDHWEWFGGVSVGALAGYVLAIESLGVLTERAITNLGVVALAAATTAERAIRGSAPAPAQ